MSYREVIYTADQYLWVLIYPFLDKWIIQHYLIWVLNEITNTTHAFLIMNLEAGTISVVQCE